MLRAGAAPRGWVHRGGCVCVYPGDAFTEVTQEGGGEAEFLGLLQVVVPELFRLWPSLAKHKTLWPTEPTGSYSAVGKNLQ